MAQNNYNSVLITGGTGFIGSALCRHLAERAQPIRLLLRDASSNPAAGIPDRNSTNTSSGKINFAVGDLLNIHSLVSACADQDIVVHLAGTAHVNSSASTAAQQHLANSIVEGTKNLLEAAMKQRVRRFVYVSSSLAHAVSSKAVNSQSMNDKAASKQAGDITHYGQLKHAAEQLLLEANARGQIEVVILRPVNVYGVGMQGNIARMISLVAQKRLPPLPALSSRISLVGVTDLVQALTLAMSSPLATGKTYTVTDGEIYHINEIEQAIYKVLGRRIPQWRTPRVVLFAAALLAETSARLWPGGSSLGLRTYRNITHDNLFDNAAICQELGFHPRSTLYHELPAIVKKISQRNNNKLESSK